VILKNIIPATDERRMEMKQLRRSADEMADNMADVLADPVRLDALRANPHQELGKMRDESVKKTDEDNKKYAYHDDKYIYYIAIAVLGLLALTAAVGSIIFGLKILDTPEVLVSLGSAAVGALVGLFAKSPTSKD
jgi:hypothetical protein